MSEAVSGGSVPFSLGNFSPDRGFTSGPQQLVSSGYAGFYPASQLAGLESGTDQVQFQNTQAAQSNAAAHGPKKSISFGEMAFNFLKGATVDTVKQVFEQLTTLPGLVMTALAIGAVALVGAPAAIALATLGLLFVGVQTLQNGGKLLSAFSSGDGELANEAARGMGNAVTNLALIIAGGAKGIQEGAPVNIKGKTYRLDPSIAKKDLSAFESFGVMLKSLFGKVQYIEEGNPGNKVPFHKAMWRAGSEHAAAKIEAAETSIRGRWPASVKRDNMILTGNTNADKLRAFLNFAKAEEGRVSLPMRKRLALQDLSKLDEAALEALAQEVELNSKLHIQAQKNPVAGGTTPILESQAVEVRRNLLAELERRQFEPPEAKRLAEFIRREQMSANRYQAIRRELETKGWTSTTDAEQLKAIETLKANTETYKQQLSEFQKAQATRIQEELNVVDEQFKDIVPAPTRQALRSKAESNTNYQTLLNQYSTAQQRLQEKLVAQGVNPDVAKTLTLKPTVALQQDFTPKLDQAVAGLAKAYPNKPINQLTGRQVTEVLTQGDVPIQINLFSRQYYEAAKINTRYPGFFPIVGGTGNSLLGGVLGDGGGSAEVPAH